MASSLVESLLRPQAYPHPVAGVSLVQTHISWVFLTGACAYKVKKPVNFGFLDFTALEKRRFYCEQEVVLNRRLSPEVYLGVVAITRQGDSWSVEGAGQIVDYAVKMRQLPQDRMMSSLLKKGEVTPDMVGLLGRKIAEFHAGAEATKEISCLGGPETTARNLRDNFLQTERYAGYTQTVRQFEETRAYCRRFLDEQAPLLQARAARGYVRDCHGDLHAANVCFADGLVVYDCIEFNERFRYGDVASDLAFMAMDLDCHGRRDLAVALVAAYQEKARDPDLARLLPLYQCYRAYVRGKVSSLKLDSEGLTEQERAEAIEAARRYFALAHTYTGKPPVPTLLIIAGIIGTGKTSLAEGLAKEFGLALVSSDVVRKTLAGLVPTQRRADPFGQGLYTPEASRATYDEMFRQADQALQGGRPVILDASFRRQEERLRARELARTLGADFLVVECRAEEQAIRERLRKREQTAGAVSDGRWEIFPQIQQEFQPVTEVGAGCHYAVDTTGRGEEAVAREMFLRLPLFRFQ